MSGLRLRTCGQISPSLPLGALVKKRRIADTVPTYSVVNDVRYALSAELGERMRPCPALFRPAPYCPALAWIRTARLLEYPQVRFLS